MEIRLAQSRDIPGMIKLLKQVGEVHHVIRPDLFRSGAQKYNEQDLQELLTDPQRPVFVAVEEDVLGYCFCMFKLTAGSTVLRDRRELYIDDLCVDEACRSGGVGQKLYDHVLQFAKDEKFDAVTLNVWCGNDIAMNFYKKQGLKPRNIHMELCLEDN